MKTQRVRTVNMEEFVRSLKKDFNKDKIEEMKTAVEIGCVKSIPYLVKNSPIDTGLYAQSWAVQRLENEVQIGNSAPHAAVIEFGARPFTPPLKPLLDWAKRVLKDPSQPPRYSDRVWSLAKYTQEKIKREGMKPRHVLQNAMEEILKNVRSEIEAVLK